MEYGKRQNALLQAEVEDGSSPQGSLPQGTLVSAVASVTYTTEPGGKPPEQILYEERNKQGRGPVLTGFERFKLEGRADREHSAVVVALELASEGCSLTREFPVFGGPIDESPGRWRLRGENLVFEPWVAPVARAGP